MNFLSWLSEAALQIRELALAFDAEAEQILERGFHYWQNETVMPAAVNCWIAEIGEAA